MALTFNPKHELAGYHISGIHPKQKLVKRANETDTTIHVDSVTIAGSLLMPKKHKHPVPVVLIIPGSGAVDRDGNEGMALRSNMYLMLVDSLAAHGIASFRYDKRGIGESQHAQESKLLFLDFVNDAIGIIHFLKKDSLFSKVILIGHSQRSLTGMLAAEEINVAAYISLEGPGEPIDQILYWQLSRKKDSIQKIALRKILNSLKTGQKVTDVKNYPVFRPNVQPFLTSWMRYDPAK